MSRPPLPPASALTRRRVLAQGARLAGASALSSSFLSSSILGAGCVAPAEATTGESPKAVSDHPLSGITSFDGDDLSPPSLVGRVSVIDFWASWCAPCRQAFKYLDQLYRTYQRDGLQVVGVCVDDDPKKGRAFRSRMRPRFSVAWDPSGQVRDRFRVIGLPTTLLLDESARIVHRHEGFDVMLHRVLETHVRRLVREA